MEFKRPFTARFRSDESVTRVYASIGKSFGDMLSYAYMGEPLGFESILNHLGRWESEYLRRGFRAVPIDDFVEAGGYGKDISDLLGVRREADEEAVSHVTRLIERSPLVEVDSVVHPNGVFSGTYSVPSTRE